MICKNIFYASTKILKYFTKFFSVSSTLFIISVSIAVIIFNSCTSSKRYGESESTNSSNETLISNTFVEIEKYKTNNIRVLIDQKFSRITLSAQGKTKIYNEREDLCVVEDEEIMLQLNNTRLNLVASKGNYDADYFILEPENFGFTQYLDRKYRGKILLRANDNSIEIINELNLEDYLKGVIAKEMPLGKGTENLEALKALSICARTYAVIRMAEGKSLFDLYADTRDQMYGGSDAESEITNLAVKETENVLLMYDEKPALLYYHSTCGGFTENSINVFTDDEIEYLKGVEDGDPPNCSISPRINWQENYSYDKIVKRLKDAALISSENYYLDNLEIVSTFASGRINELRFELVDDYDQENSVSVFGNDIRQVLKTSNGNMILWSNFFSIEKQNNSITLIGKGFGHGVGLCQWGAIALSREGWNYEDIINHYYPGVEISNLDDKN